jgi:hypothetical protein
MPDDNTPQSILLAASDAYCLLVGLALGVGFGSLVDNAAVGIGTGLTLGVASNMARRAGNQNWMSWPCIYSIVILAAYVLRLI